MNALLNPHDEGQGNETTEAPQDGGAETEAEPAQGFAEFDTLDEFLRDTEPR